MKQRYNGAGGSRLAAVMVLLALVLGLTSCGSMGGGGTAEPETVEKQAFYLNTVCTIRLQEWEGDYEEGEALVDQAFSLCAQLEHRMSRTVAGSDIDRINTAGGQPVEIDDGRVAEVLELGLDYSRLSGGRFDITVGRLAELWNFSGVDPSVPEDAAIQEAVAHVNYGNLTVEAVAPEDPMAVEGGTESSEGAWRVTLSDPEAKIDLGAVAKGYIVDEVSDFLRENGAVRGIVDFGGNISCIGAKESGDPWIIGVKRPFGAGDTQEAQQDSLIGTVELGADCSAVTSGTYERRFTQDGVLYHHILDPATGYPCDTDVSGVTIIGERSGQCDGLSTVCLILGVEDGIALIESLPDFEAVFVDTEGQVHCTSGVVFTPAQ